MEELENNMPDETEKNDKFQIGQFIRYVIAACAIIGVGVLLFSCIGVAVFFLPLLAGAFAKK